eukprot:snap_masked-scaffold_21-processed-gene-3.18-mRNA-1 protein AED:1.00 eAED:1.00 QI:0/0/0/0/1/1/2/0/365
MYKNKDKKNSTGFGSTSLSSSNVSLFPKFILSPSKLFRKIKSNGSITNTNLSRDESCNFSNFLLKVRPKTTPFFPLPDLDRSRDNLDQTEILRERLFDFFSEFAPNKLYQGFEDIVEVGLTKGEKSLDELLERKFGCSLTKFEKERQIDQFNFIEESLKQKKVIEECAHGEKHLRKLLYRFFAIVDPEKLQFGFEPLLEYIKNNGVSALNETFTKKYFCNFTNFELFPRIKNYEDKEYFQEIKNILFSVQKRRLKKEFLPEKTLFYLKKHDTERILDGGIQEVFSWAQKYGYKALNKELKKNYGETLYDFEREKISLEIDLMEYYYQNDIAVINTEKFRKVLDWGLKYGRNKLSNELLKRYEVGL